MIRLIRAYHMHRYISKLGKPTYYATLHPSSQLAHASSNSVPLCIDPQILATTNITGAIDAAFLDRADIKAFIGNMTTGSSPIS